MKILAYLLFYSWAAALVLLGGSGIFIGPWELESFFQIDLGSLTDEARGAFLNQYRFLKATEFGFGLFCFLFRKEIFTVRVFNRLLLVVVFAGALARVLAIAVDAWPHWLLVAVTIQEVLTAVFVLAYTRRTVIR